METLILMLLCAPTQDWASERGRIAEQIEELSIDVTWSKVHLPNFLRADPQGRDAPV